MSVKNPWPLLKRIFDWPVQSFPRVIFHPIYEINVGKLVKGMLYYSWNMPASGSRYLRRRLLRMVQGH